LEHRTATPVGRRVTAHASLVKVDGGRLTFEVTVRDGADVVAEARIERALVDRQMFLSGVLGD
jgi:predicted thioesterase